MYSAAVLSLYSSIVLNSALYCLPILPLCWNSRIMVDRFWPKEEEENHFRTDEFTHLQWRSQHLKFQSQLSASALDPVSVSSFWNTFKSRCRHLCQEKRLIETRWHLDAGWEIFLPTRLESLLVWEAKQDDVLLRKHRQEALIHYRALLYGPHTILKVKTF